MGEDSGKLLASAAIAGGALYLSWYLSKGVGDLKTGPVAPDEGPSTNVSHGAFVPYVIGRQRVGVLYAWTGNRITELFSRGSASSGSSSVTKGSKKKKSRASLGYGTNYLEDAFMPICVGPAEELIDIYFAGRSIMIGEQSPAPTFDTTSHPSGSSLPGTNSKGVLREAAIYWGELDQSGDSVLTDGTIGMNIASRWPGLCYIRMKALLGETPRWPLMDVEIRTGIVDTGSVSLSSSTPEIVSVTYVDGRPGLNAAHVLAQLLFGSSPYGLGEDPAKFDITSLEALGVLMETEGLLCSVVGASGESYQAMIGQVLQDISCMISWDQSQGKWTFVPIRTPSNIPNIPSSMVNSSPIEIEVRHTQPQAEKAVFRYFDVDRRYRPETIDISSDSLMVGDHLPRTRTVQLRATVDHDTASKIAERRSQEAIGQEARYKLSLSRNAMRLYPGRTFTTDGVPALLLVRTCDLNPLTGRVDINAMENSVGVDPSTFYLNRPPDSPPLIKPVASDEKKVIMEVPLFMLTQADPPTIAVPRIRNNDQVSRSDIWLSDDNVTYELLGSTRTIQTGGVLASGQSLAADGDWIQETGPEVTLLGPPDDGILQNLSTNEAAWRAGDQVVLIGDELIFVREFVAVGGGRWRMDGLIRGRMGTSRAAHAPNDDVYIFDPQDLFDASHAMLVSSNLVYVKTQPGSLGAAVDLASEVAVSRTLYMTGHRPLPPCNLRVSGQSNVWVSGDDVTVEWSYKSRLGGQLVHGNNGSGGGMSNSGQAVADAPPEGDAFILRVYEDPLGTNTLVGTITVTPGANGLQSYTFTNAQLQSLLGGEEDFGLELTERGNGLESSPAVLIIVELV